MKRFLNYFVRRIEVAGTSMLPTFVPGQRLLAHRPWRRIRVGDVVVVVGPVEGAPYILKRCTGRQGSRLELRGDNPEFSTDSRTFGPVPARNVRYLVGRQRG